MALSKRAIDTLIDLAENKLSDIYPFDREDQREIAQLKACIQELTTMREAVVNGRLARRKSHKESGELRMRVAPVPQQL